MRLDITEAKAGLKSQNPASPGQQRSTLNSALPGVAPSKPAVPAALIVPIICRSNSDRLPIIIHKHAG